MPQDAGFIFAPAQKLTTDSLSALSGGYIEVYEAGTSTPKAVYSDKALTVSLGSTVYLDSSGAPVASQGSSTRVTVYTGAAAVKLIVKTSTGTTLQTIDNLQCAQDTSLFGTGTASASFDVTPLTSDTTLTSAHDGELLQCDPTGGTFTLTLSSAITLGNGWWCSIRHDGTANQVKIATVSGQYIKVPGGSTTTGFALPERGRTVTIVCDGAGFSVENWSPASIGSTIKTANIVSRLTAPPTSPTPGARYIITGTPTGGWASYAQHDIVESDGQGGWIRYTPAEGWFAYIASDAVFSAFKSGAWSDQTGMSTPSASKLNTATFSHSVSSGTAGGAATTSAWTARTLASNSEDVNGITGCSIASNTITIPAGEYLVFFQDYHGGTASVRTRFKSTTTTKVIQSVGGVGNVSPLGGIVSGMGRITLTASEDFKLEYYRSSSSSANDLGVPVSTGSAEIYARVTIVDINALQGPRGATGLTGNTGADGADAGFKYTFDSGTSGAGISSGGIRFNNASLGSVTQIFLHKTDADSNALGNEIATWDDSTSSTRAKIKVGNTSGVLVADITGALTDNTTYYTIPVTVRSSRGSITGTVRVAEANAGDKGDTGTSGAAATIAVGTVTTGAAGSSASVTNVGSSSAATFNFTIPRGDTGATGPNTALDYAWDTGTADAHPGAGLIRVNNATLGSATFAYISKTDRPGNSQGTNIDQWDASTNAHLGTLRVFDVATRTKGFTAEVTTAFTDGTTYWKIPLNSISALSGGAPAASDVLAVVWSRTGNKGADGAGTGDTSSNTSISVDSEIALFSSTTGKLIKRATTTGILKGTSGVLSAATAGTDYVAPGGALGTPSSGTLTNATGLPISTGVSGLGAGVATFLATPSSANLISAVTDETGTGALVFATSPTLVTPNLGTPSALTLTNATGLPASGLVTSTTQAVGFGSIELGHASDTTLARSAAGEVTIEGTLIQKAGRQTIWVPASAMTVRTTNGAATGTVEMTTNKNMFATLDFDTTTQEFAQFEIHMPKSWNLSTVTFQPVWSHASTTTNFGVVWALEGIARSDNEAGDVAFGTAQTSTDTGGTTNNIYIGPESAAITVGGTPAAGDTVQFQIKRNPSDASDTLAVDARLHGIRLFYTTNASTDA